MESNAAVKISEEENYSSETLGAVGRSFATIEFTPNGDIITANDIFLKTMGYSLKDIQGKHHRMFVDNKTSEGLDYRRFWEELANGKDQNREFKRVTATGETIWLKASYMPVSDRLGRVIKVIKLAQNCTADHVETVDLQEKMVAIGKVQAVIEFKLDGTVVDANENFLTTLGYRLEEIKGQHHSMFVDETTRNSSEYAVFWQKLNNGEFQSAEYKRIGKGGKEVWIQASYNPINDISGRPCKVVKLATDVTAQKLRNANFEGQLVAIGKAQAVIEFNMDGSILTANDNFLTTLGYTLKEIEGKQHSMFVDESFRNSPDYRQFWTRLNNGEFVAGEFKRVAKGGKEVWIQASYNPIFDLNGRAMKVVKFATDITKQKLTAADSGGQIAALHKAQAVIEFNLDGSVITANKNFLDVLGYTAKEIEGKHHSMFVDETYARGNDYRLFWEKLNRGEFGSGQYQRIGKGGKEIWIQASYNPIMDMNGKPYKVVKFAVDITDKIRLIEELSEASNQVATAAQELNASATQMNSSSETTTNQANQASAAADQVSKGVAAVATNTEEMQASIKEIARNANEASCMSSETKAQAHSTNNTIQKLGESSKEIGNVIKVISSIAQQTNLLALNATIEAARAGDAGRGFAVVANEVKELAKQTAKATEEITNKIGAIQGDSLAAVSAISVIGQSIEKLNSIAGAIAASVEEQAATTGEVARVVKESNSGVQGIADNVRSVSTAAHQTSQGANQILDAAKGLQELATRLQGMVKRIQN